MHGNETTTTMPCGLRDENEDDIDSRGWKWLD